MHQLKLNVVVKEAVTPEQLLKMDRMLHVKVNEFLLSLPISTPCINNREMEVIEYVPSA